MPAVAVDLDHIGTAVRSLDAGRQAFEKLGFKLTERSYHKGATTPGGPIEPWGSANHCAMLPQGYLEVIGIVDASKFTTVKGMLERYEGPHIVAFRPASAEAVQSLVARGLPIDPGRALERMAPYGPDGSQSVRVAFRNSRFASKAFAEAQFQYTEHFTRPEMWQPHLIEHPNGALALDTLFLCTPDPAALAAKLAPVLGMEPAAGMPEELVFPFEASALRVLTPRAWLARSPGTALHPLPAPVGYTVRVRSLRRLQEVLARNGVPWERNPDGGLRVGTAHACGNVMHFVEERKK